MNHFFGKSRLKSCPGTVIIEENIFRKGIVMKMDMLIIFDAVIFLYGVYTVYSSIKMKRTQELTNFFMGNSAGPIRDPHGYINYIYGRTIVLGSVAALFGVAGFINDFVVKLPWVMNALVVLFLTVVIWFTISINRAKRRFW